MFAAIKPYGTFIKWALVAVVAAGAAYLAYDYGVTSEAAEWQARELKINNEIELERLEAEKRISQQRNRALQAEELYEVAKNNTRTIFKTTTQKVIKYVEKNPDSQCIVNDSDWLHIREANIKANQRLSSYGSATSKPDDSSG